MKRAFPNRRPRRNRQEGVVLIIALIVLIAMTLAGVGMLRSIDAGTMAAGNISFRQSAVTTGDGGVERARAWLIANPNLLENDNPGLGYYSTRQDSLDITGNKTEGGLDAVDWDGSDGAMPVKARNLGPIDATNAQVSYVIHRLCSIPGSPNLPLQSCATSSGSGRSSSKDSPTYDRQGLLTVNQVYYRITSRVQGAKNTVSFVQAVVVL